MSSAFKSSIKRDKKSFKKGNKSANNGQHAGRPVSADPTSYNVDEDALAKRLSTHVNFPVFQVDRQAAHHSRSVSNPDPNFLGSPQMTRMSKQERSMKVTSQNTSITSRTSSNFTGDLGSSSKGTLL